MRAGLVARMGGGVGRGAGWSRTSRPILVPFPGQGTQAQLHTARTELGEARAKLFQQESTLKELSERGEGGTVARPLIPPRGCRFTS